MPSSLALIVFSKNRPAQLDLLLRSLTVNAPDLFSRIEVLWHCNPGTMEEGYEHCIGLHYRNKKITFTAQTIFRMEVEMLMDAVTEDFVAFGMDDCVLYRPLPEGVVEFADDVLCFSLRLGMNTRVCYPMQTTQWFGVQKPDEHGQTIAWEWGKASGDLGYPGSLDFHLWRTADIWPALAEYNWENSPNEIEDCLVAHCRELAEEKPRVASFSESCVVGIPANRVSATHEGNRMEGRKDETPEALNERFLAGGRLSLATVDAAKVDGAHVGFPLVWE